MAKKQRQPTWQHTWHKKTINDNPNDSENNIYTPNDNKINQKKWQTNYVGISNVCLPKFLLRVQPLTTGEAPLCMIMVLYPLTTGTSLPQHNLRNGAPGT